MKLQKLVVFVTFTLVAMSATAVCQAQWTHSGYVVTQIVGAYGHYTYNAYASYGICTAGPADSSGVDGAVTAFFQTTYTWNDPNNPPTPITAYGVLTGSTTTENWQEYPAEATASVVSGSYHDIEKCGPADGSFEYTVWSAPWVPTLNANHQVTLNITAAASGANGGSTHCSAQATSQVYFSP